MPLSDTTVRNAKPSDKAQKLFDGNGLFLFISKTGAKSWRMKYRTDRKITPFLDARLIEHTPVVAVTAVRRECKHMGKRVLELLDSAEKAFFADDAGAKEKNVRRLPDWSSSTPSGPLSRFHTGPDASPKP